IDGDRAGAPPCRVLPRVPVRSREGHERVAARLAAQRSGWDPGAVVLSHTRPMVGPLRVSRSVTIPEGDLKWRFSRSSGPGGQSVNTADSRVELSLDLNSTAPLGPA